MAQKTEALAPLEDLYPVLSEGPEALLAAIRENIGEERITQFDLQRIRVPGGGSTSWQLSDGTEEKLVEGVVIYQRVVRSFWEKPVEDSGGGAPPDCHSVDAVRGVGTPGGMCETCPNAAFESASKGSGQACKQMRLLFLLRPQEALPSVLVVPPSSLAAMKSFLLSLTSKRIRLGSTTLQFGLIKATNKANITFARIQVARGQQLSDAQEKLIAQYAAAMRAVFESVSLDQAEANEPLDLGTSAAA